MRVFYLATNVAEREKSIRREQFLDFFPHFYKRSHVFFRSVSFVKGVHFIFTMCFQIVKESGHNIHMEKAAEFNVKLNTICAKADQEELSFSGQRRHAEVEVDYRL